ncbi:MAG: hypothetical protein ABUK01_07990 [Leptospirales bacterium]
MTDNNNSLPNDEQKPWFSIYGKITSKKHNYFGLFTLLVDKNKNFVENSSIAFSIYSDIHQITMQDAWYEFEHKIEDYKYGGNYAETISMDMQSAIRFETRKEEFVGDFVEDLVKNKTEQVENTLTELFRKSLLDELAETEMKIVNIDAQEIESGRARETETETETEDKPAEEKKEMQVVAVKLVLAPVGGKLVTELSKGDKILVTIPARGSRENYYIDAWKLKKPEGGYKSVVATIVSKKDKDNGIQVTVHFKDDIYGQVLEEEKVLVRLYNPNKDMGKLLEKPTKTAEASSKSGFNEDLGKMPLSSSSKKKAKKEKKSDGMSMQLIGSLGIALVLGLFLAYFYFMQ